MKSYYFERTSAATESVLRGQQRHANDKIYHAKEACALRRGNWWQMWVLAAAGTHQMQNAGTELCK